MVKKAINLIIVITITICIISSYYVYTYKYNDENVINDDIQSNDFTFNNHNFTLSVNDSMFHNIILIGKNGTKLFECSMTNETMLDTTLNITMTFRDFINFYIPYNFDYNMFDIIEQVAKQLNEVK